MADKFFFPNKGFLRLPTVLKVIPVGKSTWWAGVRTGRFPKPVKLGTRVTAWRADEIQALIHALNQTQHQVSVPLTPEQPINLSENIQLPHSDQLPLHFQ